MLAAGAAGPTAMWYLTRGTGTVATLLLTLSVVLGVANVRRVHTESMPRFVWDAVHRNASLLAVAFVVVHIATSLLDGFAPISVLDAVIPFTSPYRPLWLGFGAVAFDLLVAVAVTSLVRRRLGYQSWRAVHWTAYACWPLAIVHGLGTGSDTKTGWMLVLVALCVIAVVIAVVARATEGWPTHIEARLAAMAAAALVPVGLLVWLPSGPLAAGWAKRAGTPASLLPAAAGTSAPRSPSGALPSTNFSAAVSGSVRQGQDPSGLARVELPLTVAGQQLSKLDIVIIGRPTGGGGVQMTSSSVTLGTASDPSLYRGRITALQGTDIQARVTHGASALTLTTRLQIDQGAGTATGTVTVR